MAASVANLCKAASVFGGVLVAGNTIKDIPVGHGILGRVMNPMGMPIDGMGALDVSDYRSIDAASSLEQVSLAEQKQILTGIKSIDLLAPIMKGGTMSIRGFEQDDHDSSVLLLEVAHRMTEMYGSVSIFAGVGMARAKQLHDSMIPKDLSKAAWIYGNQIGGWDQQDRIGLAGKTMAEWFVEKEGMDTLVIGDNLHGTQPWGYATNKGSITALRLLRTDLPKPTTFDVTLTLSDSLADFGLFPAIDPATTDSMMFNHGLSELHKETAAAVKALLQRYRQLHDLVAILGADELSEDELITYSRGRKMQYFMSQPAFVREAIAVRRGSYVPLDSLIQDVNDIMNGQYDDFADMSFYMVNGINEVKDRERLASRGGARRLRSLEQAYNCAHAESELSCEKTAKGANHCMWLPSKGKCIDQPFWSVSQTEKYCETLFRRLDVDANKHLSKEEVERVSAQENKSSAVLKWFDQFGVSLVDEASFASNCGHKPSATSPEAAEVILP